MKYTLNYREVEIDYHFQPYRPARMHMSNGDPGYPEEGGYAEDIQITYHSEVLGRDYEIDFDMLPLKVQCDIENNISERESDLQYEASCGPEWERD